MCIRDRSKSEVASLIRFGANAVINEGEEITGSMTDDQLDRILERRDGKYESFYHFNSLTIRGCLYIFLYCSGIGVVEIHTRRMRSL